MESAPHELEKEAMRTHREWIIVAAMLGVVACDDHATTLDSDFRSLTLTTNVDPAAFAIGETVVVEIEAENRTEAPVSTGVTSGSCQMNAIVQYKGAWRRVADDRVCTADAPVVSYDPGETRLARWEWTGSVVVDGVWESLPPGVYEIVGVTGRFESPPVRVEITDENP